MKNKKFKLILIVLSILLVPSKSNGEDCMLYLNESEKMLQAIKCYLDSDDCRNLHNIGFRLDDITTILDDFNNCMIRENSFYSNDALHDLEKKKNKIKTMTEGLKNRCDRFVSSCKRKLQMGKTW